MKPKTMYMNVKIDKEIVFYMKHLALKKGSTLKAEVEKAIRSYLTE